MVDVIGCLARILPRSRGEEAPSSFLSVGSARLPRVEEVVRYTYRLRPGVQAQRVLTEEWHRCRFLWNEAVHQQKSGGRLTFGRLSKLLTAARSRNAWLRDGSQVAQQ